MYITLPKSWCVIWISNVLLVFLMETLKQTFNSAFNLSSNLLWISLTLKIFYMKLKLAHKISTNCVFTMVLTRFCSLHTTHYLVIELSNQIVRVLEVASPRKLSDQYKLASSECSLLVYRNSLLSKSSHYYIKKGLDWIKPFPLKYICKSLAFSLWPLMDNFGSMNIPANSKYLSFLLSTSKMYQFRLYLF